MIDLNDWFLFKGEEQEEEFQLSDSMIAGNFNYSIQNQFDYYRSIIYYET